MKLRHLSILTLFVFSGCAWQSGTPHLEEKPLVYEVNLMDRSDDLFKVRLTVDNLTDENAVYQFASTAPGNYQVMDIGRFVRSFYALDVNRDTIATERLSVNQWKISDPANVAEIYYEIAETWDTPVDSNQVYPMSGTSIEEDHVVINGHAVFGYPAGMQSRPLVIRLKYPSEWKVGTALTSRGSTFFADNFDHVVDSPVLMGRLTRTELKVENSKIEIFVYSKTDAVEAEDILDVTRSILLAAAEFIDGLPVERYTFLYHFEDITIGAWEHLYSSFYVLDEASFDHLATSLIPNVAAHEFYHIVTPLNIHSEVVETFNFVEPVPSRHLWLYEGTTEWAANIMLLRAGLIDLEEYLSLIQKKLVVADHYDPNYSLVELGLTSYSHEGQKQYANIYERGAIVAGLLDIRLLELSGGKRGLREVLNELADRYGPEKPFKEDEFFQTFTDFTYPEIGEFLDKYVKNAQPLPIAEYFEKLGIVYNEEVATGEVKPTLGLGIGYSDGRFVIMQVDEDVKSSFGFQEDDEIVACNGQEVTLQSAQKVLSKLRFLKPGEKYQMELLRNGDEVTLEGEILSKEHKQKHVLAPDPDAGSDQLELRKIWLKNL